MLTVLASLPRALLVVTGGAAAAANVVHWALNTVCVPPAADLAKWTTYPALCPIEPRLETAAAWAAGLLWFVFMILAAREATLWVARSQVERPQCGAGPS